MCVPTVYWARKSPPWRAKARIRDAHLLLGEFEKTLVALKSRKNQKTAYSNQKSGSEKTNQLKG